jgi:hypothetical protein
VDELGNKLYVLGIMDEIGFRGMFGSQVGGSMGFANWSIVGWFDVRAQKRKGEYGMIKEDNSENKVVGSEDKSAIGE